MCACFHPPLSAAEPKWSSPSLLAAARKGCHRSAPRAPLQRYRATPLCHTATPRHRWLSPHVLHPSAGTILPDWGKHLAVEPRLQLHLWVPSSYAGVVPWRALRGPSSPVSPLPRTPRRWQLPPVTLRSRHRHHQLLPGTALPADPSIGTIDLSSDRSPMAPLH
jgi:hypothetical protein